MTEGSRTAPHAAQEEVVLRTASLVPAAARRLGAALLCCASVACSSVSVSHDYDPSENFAKLKSWAFSSSTPSPPPPGGEPVSALSLARIRTAVEAELTARGYPKVEPQSASFLVAYDAAVGKQIESHPTSSPARYGWGTEVSVYDEGTLVIDIVDAGSKSLVWRGVARGAVHPDSTPEERDERIRSAVKQVLDRFPPR